jgi:hypothetical protein
MDNIPVASAMHCALYLDGYISPTTAQTIGPHVEAKAAMKKHAKMIIAYPTPWDIVPSSFSSAKWPNEAKTRKHMNIQRPPKIKAGRRPYFSTM